MQSRTWLELELPYSISNFIWTLFHTCQLLRVLWGRGGGGLRPPHWIAVGVIARSDLFRIHLYFFNHFEACMSDSKNTKWKEKKQFTSGLSLMYLYKYKEIYMYWVLFVVYFKTFDKDFTYCTKIKLVQHHLVICGSWGCVQISVWGVLRGWWHVGGGGGGDGTLRGACDPRVRGGGGWWVGNYATLGE